MVLATIRSTLEEERMIERGDVVLAAVSGGVDSVVLLDTLIRLAEELDFELHVGHVDHGLRGDASRADAGFVERLASSFDVPFACAKVEPGMLDRHRKLGPEGAAREARRDLLIQLAKRTGAAKIALGHSASDRAETVLHRLVRGTGPRGLRGIGPVNAPFIRPLIRLQRSEILRYAEQRGLEWCEDESNADVRFTRNRLRHRVLPELEQINPRAAEAILRASDLIEDEHQIAKNRIATLLDRIRLEEEPDRSTLDRKAFSEISRPEQRLLLREAIRSARGDLRGIEHTHVEAIRDLIGSDRANGELCLPRLRVRVEREALILTAQVSVPTGPWSMTAEVGKTEIPEAGLALSLARADRGHRDLSTQDAWTEVADEDRIVYPLIVRSRRDGDRFSPLGLGQETKLKDFLINEKVSPSEQDRLALLCDQERVLWVIGLRLSHDVRVTDETKRVLLMHAEVHG